ncbi:MAG TPA: amidase family protein, partial [Polyangia bacterium]
MQSFDAATLATAYRDGKLSPPDVVEEAFARIAARGDDGVWIALASRERLLDEARALKKRFAAGERLPLYGLPFAVKDNIDVAALPTTAACRAFAYRADKHAPVVARLIAAGALPVGKTNLDQFATGLVGVRSPYGVPRNPFDARFIVGGSSSGSAVSVAAGLVTFALGTDTAGSGRVPAAFNNIVGLKPSRGLLSTSGVVPACRSLDCVSVFAFTV